MAKLWKHIESDDPTSVFYVQHGTMTVGGTTVATASGPIFRSLPDYQYVMYCHPKFGFRLPPAHWNPPPMFGLRRSRTHTGA